MNQDNVRITPLAIFAIIATTVFAAVFALEQVYNYDLWWHLRSGALTLSEGRVPRQDTLSFSTSGAEWVNTAWLSGVLLAALEQFGGIDLLILVKASIVGLSFGAGALMLIRKGVHPLWAVALLGLAVVVARFRFLLRPQVLIFPGAVALFWFLADYNGKSRRLIVIATAGTILWVNLHGSAFLAPVFCTFLFAEALFCRYVSRSTFPATDATLTQIAMLLAMVSLAMLVTPFGVEIPRLVFGRFVVDDLLTNRVVVEEHLPLLWGSRKLFWAIMIASGVSFIVRYRSIRLFYLLTYIGTSILAIGSVRYVGFAALLQTMILALNTRTIFDSERLRKIVFSRFVSIAGIVVLLGLGLIAFQATFSTGKVYKWGLGVNESRYPVDAVNFLKKADIEGNLFNSWEAGGYILWTLPQVKTSMDGRILPEQQQFYESLQTMSLSDFSTYLQMNNVVGALLKSSDTAFVDRFNSQPNFNLNYFDDVSLVYLRNDLSLPSGAANAIRFRYIQPQNYDIAYLLPLAKGPYAGQVEEEFRRALSLSPTNFVIRFQYGLFLELMNRPEALDVYLQAAEINPALGFSHFSLGLQAGRYALKQKEWDKAITILLLALENGVGKADHYSFLGTAYYQKKNYSEAEKAYLHALQLQPEHVVSLQNIGFLFIDSGRPQDAESYFKKALKAAPTSEAAHYGFALALDKQVHPEAEQAWRNFLSKFPNSRWAGKARSILKK